MEIQATFYVNSTEILSQQLLSKQKLADLNVGKRKGYSSTWLSVRAY